MTTPKPLWKGLDTVAETLRHADDMYVCSDCDGTLTEIVDHPGLATLSPRTLAVLDRLARLPDVHVGIFSGRRLDDLVVRIPIRGLFFVGSAGLESQDESGGRHGYLVGEQVLPPALRDALQAWCARFDGAWLEDKGAIFAVHYRSVDARLQAAFRAGVRRRFAGMDAQVAVIHGKKVFEVIPQPGRDKGDALQDWIPADCGRSAVLYFGDDSIDEPVFPRVRQRGGITVVVGRRASAAEYMLDSPQHVEWFLEWLEREWCQAHSK